MFDWFLTLTKILDSLRNQSAIAPIIDRTMLKIMLYLTKLNELAESKDAQIQRRFWIWSFVLSLVFTSLIFVGLKSDYVQASTIIDFQFKVLLIIGLIINVSILLINYLISTDS